MPFHMARERILPTPKGWFGKSKPGCSTGLPAPASTCVAQALPPAHERSSAASLARQSAATSSAVSNAIAATSSAAGVYTCATTTVTAHQSPLSCCEGTSQSRPTSQGPPPPEASRVSAPELRPPEMPTTLGRLELPCRKEQQSAPLPIGSSTSAEATATSTATQLPPLLTPFTPPASHDQSVSPRVSPDRGLPSVPSVDTLINAKTSRPTITRTRTLSAHGRQPQHHHQPGHHRRQLSSDSIQSCPPLSPPAGSFAGLSLKSRSGFCLCQPDRKIPRPRNAFILFRQHLQVSVAAQHPGLSNPEISKIIGNQWRSMPSEAKQQWKNLAEEEKIRHHLQYPDYRYQPRRYGKNSGLDAGAPSSSGGGTSGSTAVCTSDGSGQTVCSRCRGTIMNMNDIASPELAVPMSIPTPAVSPHLSRPVPQIGSKASEAACNISLDRDNRGLERVDDARVSARLMQLPLRDREPPSRHRLYAKRPKPLQIHVAPREEEEQQRQGQQGQSSRQATTVTREAYPIGSNNPLSPGQKRRRPSQDDPGQERALRSPVSPNPPQFAHQFRHSSQQQPQQLTQSQQRALRQPQGYTMLGSERQPQSQSQQSTVRHATLPVVQLETGYQSEQRPTGYEALPSPLLISQRERERAAIQTIPYLNKIKLLSIIAPPVGADPRQLDAIHVPRLARARGGALIAIEGESPEAVQLVTNHLSLALSRHDKNVSRLVRTFHGPQIHPASGREGSEGSSHEDASLQYLDIVSAWRKISAEMVDFITDAAKKTGGPRLSLDFPSSSSTSALGHDQARMPSIQEIMGPGAAAPSPHLPRAAAPFRIALVPCYQLTNAEKFACTTPMSDSYSPQDHWQWMASLWRYCAGPDLTVYVRDCGLGEFHESNSFENPVEVRLERYRSLIVRRAVPSSATAAAAGVEEKALRRTVLEVEEYLAQ